MDKKEEQYWTERYQLGQTGWDIGQVSSPLKEYIDQLENKALNILIPGAGNAYEAEYLHQNGFFNTQVIDISIKPLENLKNRCPEFSQSALIHHDFFNFTGQYDLIIEQTFFSAIPPSRRKDYRDKMFELLKPGAKLIGLLWGVPMNTDQPPYGGSLKEYEELFESHFSILTLESCRNSIPPRSGKELFFILEK